MATAAAVNPIMSWSKCKIEIGATGENEAMAAALTNLGVLNDRSTTLSSTEGDTLTARSSGGIVIAEEHTEHNYVLTTRVKEMTFAEESVLNGAATSGDELIVKTNLVNKNFSLKLTPKNIGAIGIKVRKCNVTMLPGHSEEEGNYTDVTFTFLACGDGEIYRKFRVAESDWA